MRLNPMYALVNDFPELKDKLVANPMISKKAGRKYFIIDFQQDWSCPIIVDGHELNFDSAHWSIFELYDPKKKIVSAYHLTVLFHDDIGNNYKLHIYYNVTGQLVGDPVLKMEGSEAKQKMALPEKVIAYAHSIAAAQPQMDTIRRHQQEILSDLELRSVEQNTIVADLSRLLPKEKEEYLAKLSQLIALEEKKSRYHSRLSTRLLILRDIYNSISEQNEHDQQAIAQSKKREYKDDNDENDSKDSLDIAADAESISSTKKEDLAEKLNTIKSFIISDAGRRFHKRAKNAVECLVELVAYYGKNSEIYSLSEDDRNFCQQQLSELISISVSCCVHLFKNNQSKMIKTYNLYHLIPSLETDLIRLAIDRDDDSLLMLILDASVTEISKWRIDGYALTDFATLKKSFACMEAISSRIDALGKKSTTRESTTNISMLAEDTVTTEQPQDNDNPLAHLTLPASLAVEHGLLVDKFNRVKSFISNKHVLTNSTEFRKSARDRVANFIDICNFFYKRKNDLGLSKSERNACLTQIFTISLLGEALCEHLLRNGRVSIVKNHLNQFMPRLPIGLIKHAIVTDNDNDKLLDLLLSNIYLDLNSIKIDGLCLLNLAFDCKSSKCFAVLLKRNASLSVRYKASQAEFYESENPRVYERIAEKKLTSYGRCDFERSMLEYCPYTIKSYYLHLYKKMLELFQNGIDNNINPEKGKEYIDKIEGLNNLIHLINIVSEETLIRLIRNNNGEFPEKIASLAALCESEEKLMLLISYEEEARKRGLKSSEEVEKFLEEKSKHQYVDAFINNTLPGEVNKVTYETVGSGKDILSKQEIREIAKRIGLGIVPDIPTDRESDDIPIECVAKLLNHGLPGAPPNVKRLAIEDLRQHSAQLGVSASYFDDIAVHNDSRVSAMQDRLRKKHLERKKHIERERALTSSVTLQQPSTTSPDKVSSSRKKRKKKKKR